MKETQMSGEEMRKVRRLGQSGAKMGSAFLDGGTPATWFGPMGDNFDMILGITAKPFAHGGSRAFDPAHLPA